MSPIWLRNTSPLYNPKVQHVLTTACNWTLTKSDKSNLPPYKCHIPIRSISASDILTSTPVSPKWFLPFEFSILHAFSISHIRAPYPSYLILHLTFSYNLVKLLLCSFLQPTITSTSLNTNILLLFSNTVHLNACPKVSTSFNTPKVEDTQLICILLPKWMTKIHIQKNDKCIH